MDDTGRAPIAITDVDLKLCVLKMQLIQGCIWCQDCVSPLEQSRSICASPQIKIHILHPDSMYGKRCFGLFMYKCQSVGLRLVICCNNDCINVKASLPRCIELSPASCSRRATFYCQFRFYYLFSSDVGLAGLLLATCRLYIVECTLAQPVFIS